MKLFWCGSLLIFQLCGIDHKSPDFSRISRIFAANGNKLSIHLLELILPNILRSTLLSFISTTHFDRAIYGATLPCFIYTTPYIYLFKRVWIWAWSHKFNLNFDKGYGFHKQNYADIVETVYVRTHPHIRHIQQNNAWKVSFCRLKSSLKVVPKFNRTWTSVQFWLISQKVVLHDFHWMASNLNFWRYWNIFWGHM